MAETRLWPLIETFLDSHVASGLAVAVVRDDEIVSRGFGVRDVRSGAPVTPRTLFHLASVSKPFVATAVVALAMSRDDRAAALDLDAPITTWVPEFTLADGRAAEVSVRHLLSHSSGLPDVADYGWHDPQLGDDALRDFARSLSSWRLKAEPGSTFAYSNAGFELLGLALSRAMGTTFEDAVRQLVLAPLGMQDSTFLRAEVDPLLSASPHVAMPLSVPGDAYPYTRRHAPSSTLHSNLVDMSRWMVAHFRPAEGAGDPHRHWARLEPGLLDVLWQPAVPVGRPPWEEASGLGWAVGTYRGHRTLSHSGTDPGFAGKLVLLPTHRIGVVVLANCNTVPASAVAAAALDVALGDDLPTTTSGATPAQTGEVAVVLRALMPPVIGPVSQTLATSGPAAAKSELHRLVALEPAEFDLDDEVFVDAVWGAIELHRTGLIWPLLRLWTDARPRSSAAWTMTGWAQHVDGQPDRARSSLRRALDLHPENEEAASIMDSVVLDMG